nr:hypothetical protein [Stenotrophomonas geniculata]
MNRPEIDAIAEAVLQPDARRLRIAARHRQAHIGSGGSGWAPAPA